MIAECVYLDVSALSGDNFNLAYSLISSNKRREKIGGYKNQKDKLLSLGAGLITEYLLKSENLSVEDILYEANGKPYIKNNRFYFNISHSENLAVGVKFSSPVGVDVEKIRPIKKEVAIKYFTLNERRIAASTKNGFFEIWTKKESFIKMQGKSVLDIPKIDISSTMDIFFQTKRIDNHVISVCAEKSFAVKWRELKLEEI